MDHPTAGEMLILEGRAQALRDRLAAENLHSAQERRAQALRDLLSLREHQLPVRRVREQLLQKAIALLQQPSGSSSSDPTS